MIVLLLTSNVYLLADEHLARPVTDSIENDSDAQGTGMQINR